MPKARARPQRVLLDVDVVLDVLTQREPFAADSTALLAACEKRRYDGYVAAHTLTTLWYLLKKHNDDAYAHARVADLLDIVKVAPLNGEVIQRALVGGSSDFEDGVQIAAAVGVKADYIATRNLADFSKSSIHALAPAELLALLSAPPV